MFWENLHIWRFPYYINKPSLFPTGLQLFKRGHFHIFSLSYNLTPDDLYLEMWPLTSSTYEGSHFASMTQLWLKSIMLKIEPNVNLFSQQQQTADNRGQSHPHVSFLLRQATQKWYMLWLTGVFLYFWRVLKIFLNLRLSLIVPLFWRYSFHFDTSDYNI